MCKRHISHQTTQMHRLVRIFNIPKYAKRIHAHWRSFIYLTNAWLDVASTGGLNTISMQNSMFSKGGLMPILFVILFYIVAGYFIKGAES